MRAIELAAEIDRVDGVRDVSTSSFVSIRSMNGVAALKIRTIGNVDSINLTAGLQ
jgi:hypothetical protein